MPNAKRFFISKIVVGIDRCRYLARERGGRGGADHRAGRGRVPRAAAAQPRAPRRAGARRAGRGAQHAR